ncbi:hypothetical protein CHS0354_040503 [Potamilus streckersoni]|uniref:B box-type domain-containing protein n=1 Tax=Potamilus streckersoni TaxID=2493646 RepID=A0AAE0TKC0_9BIVA|nr:hypothetical protein CHS0354_040503 [Potamilus streckersoni]
MRKTPAFCVRRNTVESQLTQGFFHVIIPCKKACLLALRSKKDDASDCELQCPSCRHIFQSKDETNVESLPKNVTLASIVCKFQESVTGDRDCTCDICEEGQKARAIKKCLQCQLNYCRICLEQLHPQKGALAHHKLVHVMDSHEDKFEIDNACSVFLPSPSTIQSFGTQKYDQLHGGRYCRSCDEIYTKGDKMSGEKNP